MCSAGAAFLLEEIGIAAHEKHMPSVRAVAVDPDRGLVLLNLVGPDASVSAVIMELLRSKSNGVGFMPTLFAGQHTTIPTQLTIQPGVRFRPSNKEHINGLRNTPQHRQCRA